MSQDQQTLPTIDALVVGARLVVTDVGVFAGVIAVATPEERASVKNLADIASLYFQVHDRVHRQVTAQMEGMGELPPPVNLADFKEVLAENFRPVNAVEDVEALQDESEGGYTLH